MRIAILGAGFAGLATTWYLLQYTQGAATIDLYDPEPIGGGVSGLSSGLLHPFAGKHAKRLWKSAEGLKATHELISVASKGINRSLILSRGILRPAVTEEQIDDFKRCSTLEKETAWWDAPKCLATIPGLTLPETGGSLYIPHGLTLDVPGYLEGLWQSCALLGTQFHKTALIRESELKRYDKVVFALGYAIKHFKPLATLPIVGVKGQTLELEWPQDLPPLPHNLISGGYLVMSRDQKRCIAGATFERTFKTPGPEIDVAKAEILKKIAPFFPSVERAKILSCRAGVRAATPTRNHLPIIGKISPKQWFFAGLGSKGLLYHAYFGDLLAQALLSDDSSGIPSEVWHEN